MHGEVVALSDNVNDTMNITKVEIRGNTLGVQIQSKVDQVNIACTFAVSEQTAFDALAACKDAKFSRGKACA
jgi:hypothetical protein